jgi:hypothetical protein
MEILSFLVWSDFVALLCRHDKPVEALQLLAVLPFSAAHIGSQVRRDSASRPRVGQARTVHPELCRKGSARRRDGDRGWQQRRWATIKHARTSVAILCVHYESRLTTRTDQGRGGQRVRQAQRCRRRE